MERDVQRVAPICTKEQSIWRTFGNAGTRLAATRHG